MPAHVKCRLRTQTTLEVKKHGSLDKEHISKGRTTTNNIIYREIKLPTHLHQ